MPPTTPLAGAEDLRRTADELAAGLPSGLAPLARLAFDYRWSWTPGGDALFAAVEPHRWELCGHNPVRLLQEAPTAALERAAADPALRRRAYSLEECITTEHAWPPTWPPAWVSPEAATPLAPAHPVAFFCAEFGVHPSLPIYAGGLGVLAGDLLKAASDAAVPLVGIGLLYRQGYFHQRIDASGWQQEYWVEDGDSPRLCGARVTRDGAEPVLVRVPIRGREVVAQIWRVDVGRVPLYLLDTHRIENDVVDRWITSRLYVGDRNTRLAQYALLGAGGIRALRALGIEPSVLHLNEGHAALAPLEWAAGAVAAGAPFDAALAEARARTVFTTHTPVPAGNETYAPDEVRAVLTGLPERLGTSWDAVLGLMRPPDAGAEPRAGMTALGLRASRTANGVSRRHGGVARSIWRPLFPNARHDDDVPIGHVTNGVHVGTWMAAPLRDLLDRAFGSGWEARSSQAETWAKLADVPDAELWRTRCELRARLVEYVRERATRDRLERGEGPDYVELAARAFDPERLTLGFARRLATYKRLHLLGRNIQRALHLLEGHGGVQILLAGKAHPQDDGAKRVVQTLFTLRSAPHVGERIAYLHDYDLAKAAVLVAGCDVWVNLPRPPLEASGTSGMKAALSGAVNLSVLDGWWAEAYASGPPDGPNGFAIDGSVQDPPDDEAQDDRDAAALLEILEKDVVPLFYERDAQGVPRGWMQLVKASLRTAGLHFSARRMLTDYTRSAYLTGG